MTGGRAALAALALAALSFTGCSSYLRAVAEIAPAATPAAPLPSAFGAATPAPTAAAARADASAKPVPTPAPTLTVFPLTCTPTPVPSATPQPAKDYAAVYPLYDNKNGRYGIVAADGELVYGYEFSDVRTIEVIPNSKAVQPERTWLFAQGEDGAPTRILSGSRTVFSYTLAKGGALADTVTDNLILVRDAGSPYSRPPYGLLSFTGAWILPPVYEDGFLLNGGYAAMCSEKGWNLYDATGKALFPTEVRRIIDMTEDLVMCIDKNDRFGFLDMTGKTVIDYRFVDVWPFQNGMTCASEDGKYGFIDRTGAYVKEPMYDGITNFHHGVARFQEGELFGLVNEQFIPIMPACYELLYLHNPTGPGAIGLLPDGRVELVCYDGSYVKLSEDVLGEGFGFVNDWFILKTKDGLGLSDIEGNWVLQPQAERIYALAEGAQAPFAVVTRGALAVMNAKGERIRPESYAEAAPRGPDHVEVAETDGTRRLLNTKTGAYVEAKP